MIKAGQPAFIGSQTENSLGGQDVFRMIAGAAVGIFLIIAGLSDARAAERLEIKVLSSPRPTLVSGGDALVEVTGAGSDTVQITVNGAAVDVLRADPRRGSLVGLVSGLHGGANSLVARAGRREARLTLVNHPKDGPILSGPHMQPYECRTVEAGLGPALDDNCNAPTRVDWFYRSTTNLFKPLPAGPPPEDLARTTTIEGVSVPYIVRVETGTLNRTIYRIAMLEDPARHPSPGTGSAWNGRLAVSFGGGGGAKYNQGLVPMQTVLSDLFLSRGFAHIVASELVNDLHANAVLQGEALMMIKEHFIEQYGAPRWTVGSGGSGGAIQQYLIAQIYPGLLDGIQPEAAFPDSSPMIADCGLLENYWRKADATVWTQEKRQAVSGFAPSTCRLWELLFVPVIKAANKPGCALSDQSLVYDARSNRRGARCSAADWRVNQIGRDPTTGFARRYDDNIGLQYGLGALNAGRISVNEFLDLNEGIGGYDTDGGFQAERMRADPVGLRRLYQAGLVNSGGGGLASLPILSFRSYNDPAGDIHDRFRDIVIRDRMRKANGDAQNAVFWVSSNDRKKFESVAAQALDTMTQWLDALSAAPGPTTHAKVVRYKPAGALDAYFDAQGVKHAEALTLAGPSQANGLYPFYSDPRVVAGGPLSVDVLKCDRKRADRRDYKVAFTPEQWARLKRIFPSGVCDFSRPGVGRAQLNAAYYHY
jgi:hypothetical protein